MLLAWGRLGGGLTSFAGRAGAAAVTLLLAIGAASCDELLPEPYRYGTVEVLATRRSGEPVAGVELTLYSGERHLAYGRTGADGRFVFRSVPFGNLGVAASPPEGYAFRGPSFEHAYVDGLLLAAGTRHTIDFRVLKRGPGTVRVLAQSPAGSVPEPVTLTLYSFGGPVAEATLDSSGAYVFNDVPLGEYGVRIHRRPGLLPEPEYIDGITVDEGSTEQARFALRPCFATVAVRVESTEGGGVGAVPVRLYTPEAVVDSGVTTPDGQYSFDSAKCGLEYGVSIASPFGYLLASGTQSYRDAIAVPYRVDTRFTASFRLEPCRGRILAGVVDEAGQPIAGAGVRLYTSTATVASSKTDASGQHATDQLVCQEYGIEVTPPAGFAVTPGRGRSYIDGLLVTQGAELRAHFVLRRR